MTVTQAAGDAMNDWVARVSVGVGTQQGVACDRLRSRVPLSAFILQSKKQEQEK